MHTYFSGVYGVGAYIQVTHSIHNMKCVIKACTCEVHVHVVHILVCSRMLLA